MDTLGSKLRIAREAKGLTVPELGELTRIKSQQIEGLERDDFSKIPAPMYAKGFIKLLAQALDMESAPLLALYEKQTGEAAPGKPVVRESKVLRPAPVPEMTPEKVPEPGELRKRAESLRPAGSMNPSRPQGPSLSERWEKLKASLPAVPKMSFRLPDSFWHREAPAAGAAVFMVVLLFMGIRSCAGADRSPLQDEAGRLQIRDPFLREPTPLRFNVPEPTE